MKPINEVHYFVVNKVSGAIMSSRFFYEKEQARIWIKESLMDEKVVKIEKCEVRSVK